MLENACCRSGGTHLLLYRQEIVAFVKINRWAQRKILLSTESGDPMDASRFSPLVSTETAVFMDRDRAEQAERYQYALSLLLNNLQKYALRNPASSISDITDESNR